jgi:imidazoleglycerol phosphate dehydratase HisB
MEQTAEVERKTKETAIRVSLKLNGSGQCEISTGIPFFDHMLILLAVHGFFDLGVKAKIRLKMWVLFWARLLIKLLETAKALNDSAMP